MAIGHTSGMSTEELDVLLAVDQLGGEGHFQVIRRMVRPYRPRVVDEMMWGLSKSGFLDLDAYSGQVKLTQKGEEALGRHRWKKEPKKKRARRKVPTATRQAEEPKGSGTDHT